MPGSRKKGPYGRTPKRGKGRGKKDDTPKPRKRALVRELDAPETVEDPTDTDAPLVHTPKKKRHPSVTKSSDSETTHSKKATGDSKSSEVKSKRTAGKVLNEEVEASRLSKSHDPDHLPDDDDGYDSDDDLIVCVLNDPKYDTDEEFEAEPKSDESPAEEDEDFELSPLARKKLKKAINSFRRGKIYYSTFIERVGSSEKALHFEKLILEKGQTVVPHRMEPLSRDNPFEEDPSTVSPERLQASHMLARFIQTAATCVPGNPENSMAVALTDRFNQAMQGIIDMFKVANTEITTEPKSDPDNLGDRLAAIERELKAVKAQPHKTNSLDSTLVGLQAKVKPVWGSFKPYNDSREITISSFLDAFKSSTAVTPMALKLHWLRQRLDTNVLNEFNEAFDPAQLDGTTDTEGLIFKRAVIWLKNTYAHPKDDEVLLKQLESCSQGTKSIRSYSLAFNRLVKRASNIDCDPKPKQAKRMFVKGMKESLRAKLISLEDFESMTLATVQERLKQLEASDSVETSAHLSALTDSLDTREDLIKQGWVPPNGKKPFQKRTQKQNSGDNKKKKWSFENADFKKSYTPKVWKQRQSNFGNGIPASKYPNHYNKDFVKHKGGQKHSCCVICHRTGHFASGHDEHVKTLAAASNSE